jgi:hypothetical protein
MIGRIEGSNNVIVCCFYSLYFRAFKRETDVRLHSEIAQTAKELN